MKQCWSHVMLHRHTGSSIAKKTIICDISVFLSDTCLLYSRHPNIRRVHKKLNKCIFYYVTGSSLLLFGPLAFTVCFCDFCSRASVSRFSIFLSCFFFILLIFAVFLICGTKERREYKQSSNHQRKRLCASVN